MFPYNLTVSKKNDASGKHEAIGTVTIYIPTLAELGFNVEPMPVKVDSEGNPANQGLPEYADEKAQYAFDAICAAVKADARNKLIGGSTELREGAKIAETLEELLAVAERDGAALKAIRAMLNDFKAWLVAHSGKTENVQAAILSLAANRKALALQPADKKSKFEVYVTNFAASLTPEKAIEYSRPLTALVDACQAADALDDM